jgi:hypothetical protein
MLCKLCVGVVFVAGDIFGAELAGLEVAPQPAPRARIWSPYDFGQQVRATFSTARSPAGSLTPGGAAFPGSPSPSFEFVIRRAFKGLAGELLVEDRLPLIYGSARSGRAGFIADL